MEVGFAILKDFCNVLLMACLLDFSKLVMFLYMVHSLTLLACTLEASQIVGVSVHRLERVVLQVLTQGI